MAPQKSLEGRVALITGASRGIGAAIAKRFASEGADVIIAARTLESLKEVDDEIRSTQKGLSATILPLDLKNRDEISQIGPAVLERYGRLDIFVGNAAILGELTPLSQTEAECWDEVLDVNLTAQWLLIKSLETALLCSPAGRAIFLTSGVSGGRGYWSGYSVTKSGLEALAKTWAEETSKTNLRVNLVNPGAVRTAMRAEAYPGEDPMTLPHPDEITDIFVQLASPSLKETGKIYSPL